MERGRERRIVWRHKKARRVADVPAGGCCERIEGERIEEDESDGGGSGGWGTNEGFRRLTT